MKFGDLKELASIGCFIEFAPGKYYLYVCSMILFFTYFNCTKAQGKMTILLQVTVHTSTDLSYCSAGWSDNCNVKPGPDSELTPLRAATGALTSRTPRDARVYVTFTVTLTVDFGYSNIVFLQYLVWDLDRFRLLYLSLF